MILTNEEYKNLKKNAKSKKHPKQLDTPKLLHCCGKQNL